MGVEGKGIDWGNLATTGGLYICKLKGRVRTKELIQGKVVMREWLSDQVAESRKGMIT